MLSRRSGVGEAPGRFEDDVDAQVLPRESSWILLRENLDLVTVDDDRILARLDISLISAVYRVVFEQVRQGLGIGEVIYRHEIQIGDALNLGGSNDLTPNPSETVDAYPRRHSLSSIRLKPVAACMGPAKCHVADYPRARIVQHFRTLVQSRRRRDDVINYHHVRAPQFPEISGGDFKRACNVAQSLFRCQLRLRTGFTRAGDDVLPYRNAPSLRKTGSDQRTLIIATLSHSR